MRTLAARCSLLVVSIALGCGAGSIAPPSDALIGDGQTGSDSAPPPTDSGALDGSGGNVVPPLGGSSGGTGGMAPVGGDVQQAGAITYRLIVPASYAGAPTPVLLVYSGTEGGAQMTQNLIVAAGQTGIADFIRVVLDGVQYRGNAQAGASALDDVRARYNIDNDRTYLLGESAGTTAALALGFHLRQSWFAAYWANDINAVDGPAQNAAQLGFAPWGQVGPGGQFAAAQQIVAAMQAAGYRLPNPAPYNGPGAGQHGSMEQFLAALSWFPGKSRGP